ncbi:MAG TPA: O-antigen ligase family protein [Ignavibacteriaceae bacterium]|nr:O-antigen ligase family protein [Ignavibacteriaceae bacterium]
MVQSRFDIRIPYYLMFCVVISFVVSLFLMQLFVGLLSILWLFEKMKEKKKSLDIFVYFIIVFALIRIIAVIFSHYRSASIEIFYKELLFYLGFFSFVFYLKTFDTKQIRTIVYCFTGTATVVALVGIIRFDLNQVYRAEAFTSYTTFASYLLVALGFSVSLGPDVESRYKNVIVIFAVTFILSGIVTSLGRTVTVIAISIFIASVILRKLNLKLAIVIALLTAVICIISFNVNKTEVSQRIENPTYLSDRGILYNGAEYLAFKTPVFGFGPRTFHQTFPFPDEFNDKGVGGWHNDYFQVYFETGLPGLIIYLAMLVLILLKTYSLIKENKGDKFFRNNGYALLFAFVGLFLTTFTIGFITHVVLSIVFAFLIGLLSAFKYKKVDGE